MYGPGRPGGPGPGGFGPREAHRMGGGPPMPPPPPRRHYRGGCLPGCLFYVMGAMALFTLLFIWIF